MPKQAPLCDICWAVIRQDEPIHRWISSSATNPARPMRACCRCMGHNDGLTVYETCRSIDYIDDFDGNEVAL